ncbi:CdaR family transcriptional regulator [Niallia sp. NCCP-28]|uniref:PucR family transcriptional regulator n=1 Tax=Niallia sp. NCCP-28 TaxID=2934712 RepID=UPI002081BDF0|nr:helix-turn-helix domain-containing protein [Niallia sp. NCCP-28]GKU81669.1 hypothetical protein NCCP28_10650 [Niallia sp. NCCP-28]
MKNKLLSYFHHSIEQTSPPTTSQLDLFYWFKLGEQEGWFGIPKDEIQEEQLDLLKNLFDLFLPEENNEQKELRWSQFLYFHDKVPKTNTETSIIRIIQFRISGQALEKRQIEAAFRGFIPPGSLLIWKNEHEGLIVERNQQFLPEEEYDSFASAVQTDLYFTATFFIGKELELNEETPSLFAKERIIFSNGLHAIPSQRVLTFEKVLPYLFIQRLSDDELALFKHWFSIFSEDKELLLTIQTFIENNGHSTNTAKQLFIHRNTLQYRLDKFSEKTGFHLREQNSLLTVYLACLLYSNGKN